MDNLNNPQLDFKQQELLRRQNIAEYSISGEIDPDDDDIFDEEYYEFLKRVEGLRKIIKREDFDFLHRRADKEFNGKDIYKMIRNLRFKIHYNHYDENLRMNGTEIESFEHFGESVILDDDSRNEER